MHSLHLKSYTHLSGWSLPKANSIPPCWRSFVPVCSPIHHTHSINGMTDSIPPLPPYNSEMKLIHHACHRAVRQGLKPESIKLKITVVILVVSKQKRKTNLLFHFRNEMQRNYRFHSSCFCNSIASQARMECSTSSDKIHSSN